MLWTDGGSVVVGIGCWNGNDVGCCQNWLRLSESVVGFDCWNWLSDLTLAGITGEKETVVVIACRMLSVTVLVVVTSLLLVVIGEELQRNCLSAPVSVPYRNRLSGN